jgi:hypothetical protein
VDLLRRAADSGNVDAQYNLGVCLRRGLGVERNDAEAERLYSAAAQMRHRSAQLALGGMKAERARSDDEWTEVAHWYRLAADSGHPSAMMALAELYESGRGLASDRSSALTLYRQALEAGRTDASAQVLRLQAQLQESAPS